jgi:hypothetical protein
MVNYYFLKKKNKRIEGLSQSILLATFTYNIETQN